MDNASRASLAAGYVCWDGGWEAPAAVGVSVGRGQEGEGFAVRILEKSITHSDRPSIAGVVVSYGSKTRIFPMATDYTDELRPRGDRRRMRVRVRARARAVKTRSQDGGKEE